QGIAHVLQKIEEAARAPHVSRNRFRDSNVSKFASSGVASFFFRHARFHGFPLGKVQVSPNLFLQVFVAPLSPPKRPFHGTFSFSPGFRIPAMTAVSLSQRERSAISCRLPDWERR